MPEPSAPGDVGTTETSGRSRLFTVRIWAEPVARSSDLRGEVRAVATGAHRGFRDWDQLTEFLAEQLEEPMKETP